MLTQAEYARFFRLKYEETGEDRDVVAVMTGCDALAAACRLEALDNQLASPRRLIQRRYRACIGAFKTNGRHGWITHLEGGLRALLANDRHSVGDANRLDQAAAVLLRMGVLL